MEPEVGIFTSRSAATGAAQELRSHSIPSDRIHLLLPSGPHAEDAMPTDDAEQPGVGQAVGGVVGGAMGASAGLGLGAVVASLLVPGVGAVTAVGLAAAALFGAGGIVGGAALGGALEEKTREGLPRDEAYLYQDALSHGRSIVFVVPETEDEAKLARRILVGSGAESLDAARDAWWVGIRDVEKAHYGGGDRFESAEAAYRRGFVAALHPEAQGTADSSRSDASLHRPDAADESEDFRRGYERGLRHAAKVWEKKPRPAKDRSKSAPSSAS